MSASLILWLVVAACALGQVLLLSLQTYEHRRFARSRLQLTPEIGYS